jgi:thiosulfate dehydrogenase [quinone] large subunit
MDNTSRDDKCCDCQEALGFSLAFILLRLWIGFRTLIAGIEKFSGIEVKETPLLDEFGDPDISGAMVAVKAKVYGFSHYHGIPEALSDSFAKEPLIPNWMLGIYSGSLGPILILLGLAVILGIAPRISLFLTGILYTSLTFGLILINQSGGVAWLATQVGLIAGAILLAKHNRLSLYNKC